MKTEAWHEIVSASGTYVCRRKTLQECKDLLTKYVTDPPTHKHWDDGPYFVRRVVQTVKYTHRPAWPRQSDPGRSK